MLTKFDYTNAETGTVYHLNDDISPMSDLDISVSQRSDRSRTKSQKHGIWPTFTYRNEMEIHVEGNINADSAADFVTKRLALVLALFGDPNSGTSGDHPTVRKNGSLAIRLDGQTEDFGCDVTIDAFSGPVTWDASAHGAYLITFFNPDPWFTGLTSGNKYYWS
jgi:hypothetical protein